MPDSITQRDTTLPTGVNGHRSGKPGVKVWGVSLLAMAAVVGMVIVGPRFSNSAAGSAAAVPPPYVVVSKPLQHAIDQRLNLLGQFSPVQEVDLRAQVGGILTEIGFKDGEIVQKGELLFQIDPTPYQIRLASAQARLEGAQARWALANREEFRAASLSQSGAGSVETTDQRVADRRAAQASIDDANAAVHDAQFDLDHTRILAPFDGKIGAHQVSVGNLISGNRYGTSATTLLATIMSTGRIYFNFDMSESDYGTFLRDRPNPGDVLAENVTLSVDDGSGITRQGKLDFIDNTLDRSSGTIHARATFPDEDFALTPGGFARIDVQIAPPKPALLLPEAALLPDQTTYSVLAVGPHNVVTPKLVTVGDLRGGLRVITSGLTATDKVVIDGIPVAHPGAKVSPRDGSIHFDSNQSQR
ncbi:efflux RND transporter periplasmic adaptor subunit [Acidisoma sp. L85]|uniref:efflux RND transporter periplasmic adaptor subunit n=1 Tax=Acidisoma sp. L85 TaxID=1641850 RepID=UPI001C20178F|nr:efflux RND transporter periplasmic adaptor subunit [Acidisoma sp. L85]